MRLSRKKDVENRIYLPNRKICLIMKHTILSQSPARQWFPVIIFLIIIVVACSSPQQLAEQHRYDEAIDVLLKKSQKSYSPKTTAELGKIYHQANSADSAIISSLVQSGEPDVWLPVYTAFQRLDTRQQKIAALPESVRQQMGFQSFDYSSYLFQSRQKACLYNYTLAERHLQLDKRMEAMRCLETVNSLDSSYRRTAHLLDSLYRTAPVPLYYQIEIDYPYPLPPGMEEFLTETNLTPYSTSKVFFVNKKPDPYRLYAEIRITDVKIAPEKTGELAYAESIKIQDGLAYRLDDDGDFIRDSAGQKIEIPKFKTLACYVSDYKQEKSIQLFGEVLLVSVPDGKILIRKPVQGVSNFTHRYARFKGDLDALSPESASLIGSKKQDFPSDGAMIQHASENLFKEATVVLYAAMGNVEPN
jgi:hypothetical protein